MLWLCAVDLGFLVVNGRRAYNSNIRHGLTATHPCRIETLEYYTRQHNDIAECDTSNI